MARMTASLLLVVAVMTACLAQEADRAPRLMSLARVFDAYTDIELLMRVAPLGLTDAQVQALTSFFQEHPVAPPDLKLMDGAAGKVEAVRERLIAGAPANLVDMQTLGEAMQKAFTQFNPMAEMGKTVQELTAEEKFLWGLLTPKQQATLLRSLPIMRAGVVVDAAHPTVAMLKRLRDIPDDQEWVKERDRLAGVLSAAAGADGTPERENRRRMFVEFFNRVEQMAEADFAAKLTELGADLAALLPAGSDDALALADADAVRIHMALLLSFLNPRYPELLQEMQAAKAKPGQ